MKKRLLFLMLFSCIFLNVNSQNFITTWNIDTGSPPNAISFEAVTSGVVNYTWQSTTTSASGSGSFQGPNVQIVGLPAGETITLSIQPQNFQRFKSNFFSFFGGGLLQVNQWGAAAWISMEDAFSNSPSLQVTASDVPNLTNCTSLKNMFKDCFNLNSPFNLNAWNISTITNLSGMFQGCFNFNQALSQWNTANVTDMSSMFESAAFFNQNIGSWNTGNVTTMSKMFKNASAFDRNIGTWNTSSVTDMSEMFYHNVSSGFEAEFNRNLGNWNTSNVTNMAGMFHGAVKFNQNIGNWNTSNVVNMAQMFKWAFVFNQNLGNWNTSNVTDMSEMFAYPPLFFANNFPLTSSFNNLGNTSIGNWNTSNVVNMTDMFSRATNFNQNLQNWVLNPNVVLLGMLDNSGLDCTNYSLTLTGWNNNPLTPNNKIIGVTFLEYGPNAQVAVTNLTSTKGWLFSGHDVISTIPEFNFETIFCAGAVIPALPTESIEGILGTWSPAINNQQTTTYTFTPNVGECAIPTTVTIFINPSIQPVFASVAPICFGQNLTPLPTTSLNGINGSWSPSLTNQQTTTYFFTTSGNQCTLPTLLTIVVTPQPPAPTNLACYESAIFNNSTCSWDVSGVQPQAPSNLACWQSASFNSNTCSWDVTGSQPQAPTGLACWQTSNFNNATCQWVISGVLPAAPTGLACWQSTTFNNTTCQWDILGTQPTAPTGLACWQTALFNTATCSWDVTGSQPQAPTNLACWQTSNFNTSSCQWVVSGSQPTPPTGLACWEVSTFNNQSCSWVVTGTQPLAPTNLACYESAVFNTSNCSWNVVGTMPQQPNLACYETASFNNSLCAWEISGSQPAAPTGLACYETAVFNNSNCTWNVVGTMPQQPNLACYETASFNTSFCNWEISGTQPAAPTGLACYETALFNSTTCTWNISGTMPQQPSLACYETASFNPSLCNWEISGTQPTAPTGLACYETALFNSTTCSWDVSGSQPNMPTDLACWETAQFNSTTCQWDTLGEPIVPTFSFPTVYCIGDTVDNLPTTSLNSIEGTWSPAINSSQTTAYTFTPNEGICASSTVATIEISNYPNVDFSQLGTTLIATPGFNSYTWSINGSFVPDVTTNSIELTENGEYEVIVANNAGCTATFYFYNKLASLTENLSTTGVSIYPNPSEGMSTLLLESMQGKTAQLMIKDMHGKLYLEEELKVTTNNQLFPIDLRKASSGVYHVVLTIEEKTVHVRLVLR